MKKLVLGDPEERRWSSREDIPHTQGKRNPSKMVGVARGHKKADTLKPYSQKTSQSDHTDHSLVILLLLFGSSLLFHVQCYLLLPDLHAGFSRGRPGGLVFPSLSEFSTVRSWHIEVLSVRCHCHCVVIFKLLNSRKLYFILSIYLVLVNKLMLDKDSS